MEKELSSLKKKDKEHVNQVKASKMQKERIQSLTEEVEGMKAQKIKLLRQIKEEKGNYTKWKDEKTRSLLKMKRENQKKDQEILKLKKENSKKSNILRRKVEELQALQKRQKLDVTKHKNALKQKQKSKKIDPEKIKQWVAENTQKLIRYQDIKEEIEKEEAEKRSTEKQIEEEQSNYAMIQTKKEKLEASRRLIDEDDLDKLEDIDQELRGFELELEAINENISSLDEKLEFVNEKISVFNKEVIEINPEGIEALRFEEINNLEEAKVYLGSFFNIFLEMNVYRSMVENKIVEQQDSIDKLNNEITELNNKIHASEIKFREEIHKISDKYKKKQDYIKSEMNEFIKLDLLTNMMNNEDFEKMLLESPRTKKDRSISDLSGKNAKQLRDEIKQRKQALKDVARVQATSKIGLSKLVTTLENKVKEDDKKLEILNHKLAQAAQEKQRFKQKYETLRAQIKSNETEDIKLIKTISLETRGGEREKITKSPFHTSRKPPTEKSELKSLSQVRKERNKIPPTLSSGSSFK